jgi:sulfur carrier protein ThiS
MRVVVEKERKALAVSYEGTLGGLLEKLSIPPESIVASRAGTLLGEDSMLEDEDEIVLHSVISGG